MQMMVYPTQIDERTNLLVFKGLKGDNQIECLLNCEQEMELTGNALTYKEKINFISKDFQGSATRWYTIGRDNSITNEQFKNLFEGLSLIHILHRKYHQPHRGVFSSDSIKRS